MRVPGFGLRVSNFGFRVSGLGFRVSGFGFRVSGAIPTLGRTPGDGPVVCCALAVTGQGFRGWGVEIGVQGLLLRVQSVGCRV